MFQGFFVCALESSEQLSLALINQKKGGNAQLFSQLNLIIGDP